MSELGSGGGSSYPSTLDTDNTQESSSTTARSDIPNDLAEAIVKIENELGTDPAGTLTDVKTFLQTEHNTNGTHNVAATSLRAGQTVQTVHTQTGAVATGTTAIPFDDTIPQITEGDEYMTLAITPTNSSNKLIIEAVLNVAQSVAADPVVVALFQDTTANALAVAWAGKSNLANSSEGIFLRHEMTANIDVETTLRIRAGNNTGATTTFNGSSGARKYGGVFASSIRISEVKV
jgi:hypothetical protein